MIGSVFVSAILMSQKLRLQTTLITVLDFKLVFPVLLSLYDVTEKRICRKCQSQTNHNLPVQILSLNHASDQKKAGLKEGVALNGDELRHCLPLCTWFPLATAATSSNNSQTSQQILFFFFFHRNQCFIYWSLGLFNGSLTGLVSGSERTDQLPQIHWK